MKYLLAVLILGAGHPARAQEAIPLSLPALLEEARAKNPAVQAAFSRSESARAKILPARTWKDPKIGVHQERFPGQAGMPEDKSVHYSVEQEIPFPGKLSRESRMRYHESRIAQEEYRARLWEVLSEVKIHYYRLLWLDRTAQVLKKDAEILRSMARVAQSRIAAGKGGAEEALIAQAQLKGVENAVFERQQQRLIEEEDLNAFVARPPGTRWGSAPAPSLPDLPHSVQELEAFAREASPMYLETVHMVHHAQLMTSLGRYGFAPDFTVGYEQERFRNKPTETMVGASLNIPIWFWRPLGELRSARSHTAQALAESQDARNTVFKELYKEFTEVRMHRRLALSYAEEILPLAEGAVNIALKNYETGRTDFAKLSEAVRTLLDAQMKYYEQIYHYGEHWSMLERIVGREIGESKDEKGKKDG